MVKCIVIKRYFVTGTDTKVGKTMISCTLLKAANCAGYSSVGYKPVASGGKITTHGFCNSDALALQSCSSVSVSYNKINPYLFSEETSPHIISLIENKPIQLEKISLGLRYLEKYSNWLIIEGAGGWFTPLSFKYTFADWVKKERIPVILVVNVKLGCINHALLTVLAIKQAKLSLVGWIANNITIPKKYHVEYLTTLCHMIPALLLGEIPYISNIKSQSLEKYLNIDQL
ncbi:ATP-dependent dethiobiotin synthetase BioD 1 [Candidatus Ecksteinia adelgidicola]|nr:ATP-dependent dethiobiotin synthetase BioD 1 [Candidatus Ecksteinia adelgidicola]